VLVLKEPDLGTAASICATVLIMLIAAGVKLRHILPSLSLVVSGLCLTVSRVDYMRDRIMTFLNPWQDPDKAGYQIIQSLVGLGSGGITGVGLARSQQKLYYLPAAHTDFVLSILGEELGLAGTAGIVLLFFLFLLCGLKVILGAKDLYGQLLATGVVSMILLEAVVNIAVATGSVPTKGLPLPFVSYGGSAIVAGMIGVGLLLNVAKNRIP
jgi:cell division protein FtsW